YKSSVARTAALIAGAKSLLRLTIQQARGASAIVLKPAHNLVAVDHTDSAETFVVVQVGYAVHRYCAANDRSENVAIGSATINCNGGVRRVARGDNLAVPAETDVPVVGRDRLESE